MPFTASEMFGLMDCNNFYASCERLFRPDLTNRPVVVLSNNDGCIIARSNEAKALGIGMGTPYFKQELLVIAPDPRNPSVYWAQLRVSARAVVPFAISYRVDVLVAMNGILEKGEGA